jgi:hypothetical protein
MRETDFRYLALVNLWKSKLHHYQRGALFG